MSLARTYLDLFRRNPALARLLAGEFISGIGDWLYLVAILVMLYERTQDPVLLGIVAFIVTDRRVAGMYFVALILLLVADWRYRRYARTSAEARRAQTEIERP